jgi:transmembrane sensor
MRLFVDRPVRLHTDTGESRVVVLQDKSVMHLNTRSDVVVQISRWERHVELVSGEAFFEVATDAQRPFVVRSGLVSARALGTKFAVTKRADVTLVTVAEGRVLVAEQNGNSGSVPTGARAAEIGAGEQALAAPRGISKARVDAQTVLAWRDGKLVFDGDSLGKVVDEFNRYNRTPIVIADPAVAERRVSGVFSVHDPESLMQFLERSGDVSIHREENGTVTIGASH